ncbi:MAG: dTDP-4-dehydrorhamnose 3,5-epimerase [Chlamydiae bacterium RIFCSPHIGHO2_12_FULL_49_11]|nr:MAG: dTDP-4-dehydrorhamnose 3,5-epimerase [Chlamydiae bacterium RIFCSPHIGHO2_12_FULL_49_11]
MQEVFLDQPRLITSVRYHDERGFFSELFRDSSLSARFVQDNCSFSKKGVIRGLHFQPGQSKYVTVLKGAIFDVALDIRPDSPAFGTWQSFELSFENGNSLFVPDGFAHGFCVLTEEATVMYKVSAYYDPLLQGGIHFLDPMLQIPWPVDQPIVSRRDQALPCLGKTA